MPSWLSDIEDAPVVSAHDDPQPSPQEWDCSCVTAVYVTDRDGLRGGQPFEMRLVKRCGSTSCQIRRHLVEALLTDERSLPSRGWPWTTERLLEAMADRVARL